MKISIWFLLAENRRERGGERGREKESWDPKCVSCLYIFLGCLQLPSSNFLLCKIKYARLSLGGGGGGGGGGWGGGGGGVSVP